MALGMIFSLASLYLRLSYYYDSNISVLHINNKRANCPPPNSEFGGGRGVLGVFGKCLDILLRSRYLLQ
jgi:hypothetical protein